MVNMAVFEVFMLFEGVFRGFSMPESRPADVGTENAADAGGVVPAGPPRFSMCRGIGAAEGLRASAMRGYGAVT